MRPPETYVVACPRCAALHRSWSQSGNTFGATLWSDGKVVGPMVPTPAPEVARCAGCARFFWLRDGETWWPQDDGGGALTLEAVGAQRARVLLALRQHLGIGVMQANALAGQAPVTLVQDEPRERVRALADALREAGATARWGLAGKGGRPLPPEWGAAPFIEPPGEAGLLEAIGAGVCATREDEVNLRREVWWLGNDAYRAGGVPWVPYAERTQAVRDNLARLFALLGEEDPDERLMKAEAARQLRRFAEAEALLAAPFAESRSEAGERLAELARVRYSALTRLFLPPSR